MVVGVFWVGLLRSGVTVWVVVDVRVRLGRGGVVVVIVVLCWMLWGGCVAGGGSFSLLLSGGSVFMLVWGVWRVAAVAEIEWWVVLVVLVMDWDWCVL